ncbi:MAG TPA: hypothetical protein VMT68_17490 [Caulobacteraceae bacterium]|nr:hypothetical protein [Caulobacteraceae bacterium]
MRMTGLATVVAVALALAGCQKGQAPAANSAAQSATAPATAQSADAADVKSFLAGLYAHYATPATDTGPSWAPLEVGDKGNGKDVLDPELVTLMQAYDKSQSGDEVGPIDGDWICDCQDWEKITATITVDEATATTAKAHSDFTDTAEPGKTKHVTFELAKTAAGWRIHDMGTAEDASLRAVLTKAIADAKAHPHKTSTDEAP